MASLSLGLSYGVAFLRVTDNPLELWSSKQSQSRIERTFYEGAFDPFYRVAHVIITPTKQEVSTVNIGFDVIMICSYLHSALRGIFASYPIPPLSDCYT